MTSRNQSARPGHRRTVSNMYTRDSESPSMDRKDHKQSDLGSSTSSNKTASRLMFSMRRPFTSTTAKKNQKSYDGMISTLEESTPFTPPQYCTRDPSSSSRPTIEQIAMGLHVSRTPHLRPLSAQPYTHRNTAPGAQSPHRSNNSHETPLRRSASPHAHAPTPARSSMKKPSTSNSTSSINPRANPGLILESASSSTIASNGPHTPNSSHRSIVSIKSRMSRFLPKPRNFSAPPSIISSPVSSPRESLSDYKATKKAVRFSTQVVDTESD